MRQSGYRPVGVITRGTTNPNRLRRIDRYLASPPIAALLRRSDDPVVIDLGFGASPVTTVELWRRLRGIRTEIQVVGLDTDPQRVEQAQHWLHLQPITYPGLDFQLGGFDIPRPGQQQVTIIRAANVLRQYHENDVPSAWHTMGQRLAPHGVILDATCDEIGRRATWLTVTRNPTNTTAIGSNVTLVSLTLAARLDTLRAPSELAERLPKSLIHHNVPGKPVHSLFAALDTAWTRAASAGTFGARYRWLAAITELRTLGWPVLHSSHRWRLGEVTFDASVLQRMGN